MVADFSVHNFQIRASVGSVRYVRQFVEIALLNEQEQSEKQRKGGHLELSNLRGQFSETAKLLRFKSSKVRMEIEANQVFKF